MATSAPSPDREKDPRPVVARPRAGLPGATIAAIAAIVALLLFLVLDARRHHHFDPRTHGAASATDAFPAPPALIVPPETITTPAPIAAPHPVMPARPARSIPFPSEYTPPSSPSPPLSAAEPTPPQPAPPPRAGASTGALVFDNGAQTAGAAPAAGGASGGDDAVVATTVIRNHTTIMPTGTVIPAVLETPIDSTRPGLVRAVVSEDARGFDGKRVLIPRGSRLIGDYASDIRSGQKRVLVNWQRLIRPDGVAIRIGSPAADALGGAGIPGKVNTFFFQRFASAVLQSALAVGVNLASRPGNGSVIVGLPNASTGTIGQDLVPSSDLKPRVRVKEGAVLTIFVAHDLDFSGTPRVGQDRP